jgi:small-conductance mechanosensitive channel
MTEIFKEAFDELAVYFTKLPVVLIFGFVGWVVVGFVRKTVVLTLEKAKIEPSLVNLLGSVITFVGWVTIAATVFSILGLNQVSLAFSGSIALVAMGLASSASGIVGDLLAGIYLIADPDFKIGVDVKVGAIEGTVISMDIRKTKVQDKDGNLQVLPNKTIDSSTYVIRKPIEMLSEEAKAKEA